jgi:hypothetical protein
MKPDRMCNFFNMHHWTIIRLSALVLLGVLTVIVLVLVLPQVDLLDTAFHSGTAPIAVHARATAKPHFQTLSCLFVFFLSAAGVAIQRYDTQLLTGGIREFQILNHCFRC